MILTDSVPALTPEVLNAFEDEIGGRLPDDYKRFLLKSNGGWNEPTLGLHWNGELHKVPDFCRLLATDEIGIRRALRNLREMNIDGYLPITSTQNGEDICLDFRDNIGTVWLLVYFYENDVPVDATKVYIAESFTEFLKRLVEMPEPYCRIEELGKRGTETDLEAYLAEGNSIDAVGKNGHPIVREAIKFGNLSMIEACINRGASLSKTIHQAVKNRRPDLVKRFVEAGVDVNEQDEYGDRPMSYVGGTALPGDEGALNRSMKDLLIELGAK
jgi:cell wall assembly regulator SMI1